MITVEIKGLADLERTFANMTPMLQKRALRGMVATAAGIIRDEAAIRAPIYFGEVQLGHPPPGTLKKAIYRARLSAQCTTTQEVWVVSVRKGRRAVGGADAYYATWVEYGTVKMSPRPFMRPAFETKKQAATNAMGTYLAFKLPEVVRAAKAS